MPIQILMPALSPTMEVGTLAKWLVKEGDAVASGDMLAEIETDKATMELEAVDEGVVGKILVPDGTENIAINTPIAVILEDGEEAGDIGDVEAAPAAAAPEIEAEPEAAPELIAETVAAPVIEILSDPDLPEGTTTRRISVREALRDAMAEEMRRDENVFLMGEEVAQYQGAYKVSQGLLDEFGGGR